MVERLPFVLFGDSNLAWSRAAREELQRRGVRVAAMDSSRQVIETVRRDPPDVLVVDDQVEDIGSRLFLSLVRTECAGAPIILLLPPGTHPERDDLRHLDPVCCLVRPVGDRDLLAVITAALRSPGPAARPPVVFCVDDDEVFLKSLVRVLRRRGFAAIPFTDPEEALEAIPVLRPDLAFLDVLMPGMNGLDLASEIREDYGDALPLVLLSARTSDHDIAEGYRSGATRYVTKPCEPDTILGTVDQLLRLRPGPGGTDDRARAGGPSIRPARRPSGGSGDRRPA